MTISKRYLNDGKPTLVLNSAQAQAVVIFKSQNYPLVKSKVCPICNKSEFECLSEKDRYGIPLNVVICSECGFVFANPYYEKKALKDFYQQHSPRIYRGYDDKNVNFLLSKKYEQNYRKGKKIFDFISSNWKKVNGMLVAEVGVGAGGILGYFRDNNNQVIGTDFETPYLKHGSEQKLNLLEGGIEKLLSRNVLADVVIYSDVLEHVPDLTTELSNIRSILKDDGCLFVGLPSVKNLEPYQMDFLRQIQNAHVHYFSLKTLTNLMKKNGFELVAGNERIMALFQKGDQINYESEQDSDYVTIINYIRRCEKVQKSVLHKVKRRLFNMSKKIKSILKKLL
jgi:2-polyprenyl-3-methyl-5-hydroxy-6-metoxy-1,4-benzoquinol methylase